MANQNSNLSSGNKGAVSGRALGWPTAVGSVADPFHFWVVSCHYRSFLLKAFSILRYLVVCLAVSLSSFLLGGCHPLAFFYCLPALQACEDLTESLLFAPSSAYNTPFTVTLKPPKKRQIADSVFSNIELNGVNLCAEYKLPFAILAENANRPFNRAREDSNLQPSDSKSATLSN